MIPTHEQAAADRSCAGRTIQPCDRVLEVPIGLIRDCEELVEAIEPDCFHLDCTRADRLEAEFSPGDKAGEAQPTNRGAKKIRILFRRANDALTAPARQFKFL